MGAAVKIYATQYVRPKEEEQHPQDSGDILAPVKGISWALILGGLLWLVTLTLVIFLIG